MRTYSLIVTLFLSFLIPLQVVADTLLSQPSCNTQLSTPLKISATITAIDSTKADCCHNISNSNAMDCKHMQNCHGCSAVSYVSTLISSSFFNASRLLFNVDLPITVITSFDPAPVWRPPINS